MCNKVICPYCLEPAKLVDSEVIYGRSYGNSWLCVPCDAYVGCHKGTNKPLGRLANKDLRQAKMKAHIAFDPLWKSKKMTRREAYIFLANKLGVETKDCHIGMFSIYQCDLTVTICDMERLG